MSDQTMVAATEPIVTDRFDKAKKKYYLYGALLLAVLLVINVVAYVIPLRYTAGVVVPTHPTTLSRESRNFVKSIDRDIDIYCLTSTGELTVLDRGYERLLKQYDKASSHITVKMINTTENPEFIKQYNITSSELEEGMLVIHGPDQAAAVYYSDLVYYTNAYYNEIMGQESALTSDQMQALQQYAYQYLGTEGLSYLAANGGFKTYSCAEVAITSTLDYVLQDQDNYVSPYSTSIQPLLTHTEYLSDMTVGSALLWGGLFVVVIPFGLLITGIVIWARRRKA